MIRPASFLRGEPRIVRRAAQAAARRLATSTQPIKPAIPSFVGKRRIWNDGSKRSVLRLLCKLGRHRWFPVAFGTERCIYCLSVASSYWSY